MGNELLEALLDTERAPSNVIWILFDYIYIHKKGTFHPFQNVGGRRGARATGSYAPETVTQGLGVRNVISKKIIKLVSIVFHITNYFKADRCNGRGRL